ncbi:MAG: GntR family transcriptional regulator [Spirochaetia bacterium]|nr:GntR family transcriptional regulator [Spirochaetia bacterium]
MKRKDIKPLYLQMKEYLLNQIQKMDPGINQLEPENLLSKKLGMSRETVRKAMSVLIQEGVITRWHGKGNFGHPSVSNLIMRVDVNSDFRRLLRNAGYTVKTERSESELKSPSKELLNRIPEALHEEILFYELLFFADTRLAIHVNVELFNKYVTCKPESGIYTEVITDELKKYCDVDSAYSTAWQRAGISPDISSKFGIHKDTPLLIWDEIYHDLNDYKFGYVEIHFNPEIMDISMKLNF